MYKCKDGFINGFAMVQCNCPYGTIDQCSGLDLPTTTTVSVQGTEQGKGEEENLVTTNATKGPSDSSSSSGGHADAESMTRLSPLFWVVMYAVANTV